jgi:hypothetical protein
MDWRLPAAVVAVVLLIAAAVLLLALDDVSDDAEVASSRTGTTAATAPAGTSPGPPVELGAPGSPPVKRPPTAQQAQGERGAEPEAGSRAPAKVPGTTKEPPAPSAGEPQRSSGGARVRSWPEGKSAYTVVLLSAEDESAARAQARKAASAGVPAGVLRSSDHSSLKPGYWVAFGGQFDSNDEAQREARRYASLGAGKGYVRFVSAAR